MPRLIELQTEFFQDESQREKHLSRASLTYRHARLGMHCLMWACNMIKRNTDLILSHQRDRLHREWIGLIYQMDIHFNGSQEIQFVL